MSQLAINPLAATSRRVTYTIRIFPDSTPPVNLRLTERTRPRSLKACRTETISPQNLRPEPPLPPRTSASHLRADPFVTTVAIPYSWLLRVTVEQFVDKLLPCADISPATPRCRGALALS